MHFGKVKTDLLLDWWELGAGLSKPARIACVSSRECSCQLEKGKGDFLALASRILNLASLEGCCGFPQLESGGCYEGNKSLPSSSSWPVPLGPRCLYLVYPTHKVEIISI